MNSRPWCLYDWQWPGGKNGPGAYSWFHFLWIFICIAGTFCLSYFVARKHDKKKDLLVCRIFAIELVTLEIIKVVTSAIYREHFVVNDVSFAFCSIPIYLLLVASFFKDLNKKVPDACIRLAAYFGLIGGLAVMIYPAATLAYPFVYYSIHTMLWHSSLICFSIYYFVSKDLGKNFKNDIIPTSIGFVSFTSLAIIFNETIYYTYYVPIGSKYNPQDKVNFFWISRHFDTSYPVLGIIKKNAPFPVFILCFIITVLLIILLIHYITRLIKYHTIHKVK